MCNSRQRLVRGGSCIGFAIVFAVVAGCTILAAQNSNASAIPAISPGELVRAAIANEVAAANNTVIKHMFLSRTQNAKGSQTKLYVETNDAVAGMLVAINDQPLTPQQQQGETNRLAWLAGNPEALRKKHAREKDDADRSVRILKALPAAFLYEYVGIENAAPGEGRAGSQLVRLKFRPNPSYAPPTRAEQVLSAMQGFLLIDAENKRLALIDGTLFKDVTFGWGVIGRLDKGGHFLVKQAEAGDGTWDITEMNLNITGKILLFKTLSFVSDEVFSDFHRAPDNLPFAQGVEMLKTERERLAQSDHIAEPGNK
jgi:hypothetical protein